jgi:hypothetical protein
MIPNWEMKSKLERKSRYKCNYYSPIIMGRKEVFSIYSMVFHGAKNRIKKKKS